MKIYLASADLADIQWAAGHKLIDGVLTTHEMLRGQPAGDDRDRLEAIIEAAHGTVFITARAVTGADVYRDARELAKLSDHVVVQVPFLEDLVESIHRLAGDGVKVAASLVFSAAQALIASRVGASAVVVPMDALDSAGHDSRAVLGDLRAVLDGAACECDVIAFRPATAAQFSACAAVGVDAIAVDVDVLRALLVHPLTDRGIDQTLQALSRQHASWSLV